MASAAEVGAEGRGAEIVERSGQRAPRGGGDGGFERREHALAIGLAERHQPHAGRHPVGGERLEEGGQREVAGNAVAGGRHRDGNGISDRAVPDGFEAVERAAWPCAVVSR